MQNIPARISIIVAAATNQAIGKDNQLLWHLPNDLRFFKKTTTGHPIIMGRKTYESVGRPLPNRRNIVITRRPDYLAEGVEVAHSLAQAIALATDNTEEIFIVGGAEIYKQALPLTDRIYLTRVHTTINGDTYFPEFDSSTWRLLTNEEHPADEKHAYGYSFQVYDRMVNENL